MVLQRMARADAERLLRHCVEDGLVVVSRHFLEELAQERCGLDDAYAVLRAGTIYEEPEQDIRSGEWKYRVEGYEPGGKWLAIVFCFKKREEEYAFMITVFSVERRSRTR